MIPVSSIEYVNVRIGAFHGRLFDRGTYEALLDGDTLGAVTTFLLDHPQYREDIERALEHHGEREGLERGVTNHFTRCVNHVHRLSEGRTHDLFTIGLSSFDLKNIRTIVVAHLRKRSFREVEHIILPCSMHRRDDMARIYAMDKTTQMLQELPTCCPLSHKALRKAAKDTEDREPAVALVNRLEKNLYASILRTLERDDENASIIRDVYRYEIDLKNIVSALKHVWRSTRTAPTMERYIRGGTLREEFLVGLAKAKNLDEALEMIETTQYHEAVEKGLIYYAETGFLHEMERFFEEVFIKRTQTFKRRQPFGTGPFLSYIWAQYAEMTNLRTIINGIAFKTGAGQIRKGLIHV